MKKETYQITGFSIYMLMLTIQTESIGFYIVCSIVAFTLIIIGTNK